MEMLGIICNNYGCNWNVQINFVWEIENYLGGVLKKGIWKIVFDDK